MKFESQTGLVEYDDADKRQMQICMDKVSGLLSDENVPTAIAIPSLMLLAVNAVVTKTLSTDDEILAEFKRCLLEERFHTHGKVHDA